MSSLKLPTDEKILVFVTDFNAYHLTFVQAGIQQYFEQGEHELSYVDLDITELWRLFGDSLTKRLVVIGFLRSKEAVDFFESKHIPCLNLEEEYSNKAIGFDLCFKGEGTMVAQYFIDEMKLENLGFIGNETSVGHQRRLREFQRVAEARHVHVDKFTFGRNSTQQPFYVHTASPQGKEHHEQKQALLTRIPKPCGIFCANDRLALDLYYTAELMGFSVPNEVSIIGVGSRSNKKDRWARAVSVVELNHFQLGFTGAKMLDAYFKGKGRVSSVSLPPSGIHHSQTSLRRLSSDPMVSQAMSIIQQSPELSVKEIAQKLNTTRKILDLRFLRFMNMTTTKAIDIERFSKAKKLIKESEYNLESISSLAGYPNREGMRRSFFRFTRMSPNQFRKLGTPH